ncbi:glutamate--tRNA ligase family protein [Parapedobacter deserti]|uniref:Glutamate--tRNA ligase family protein n=1 Tax=Parapedobacter deserti TaxID=1912957 RepID=A0ABV7JL25_9SPHI
MQQFTSTRIAPTPSGFLHLGNAYSFALTAALAKRSGAQILLRIDDLDRKRVKSEYLADIFDTLSYLEIPWDTGPRDYHEYEATFSQVHRMALYEDALRQLRAKGVVFACDCSRTTLLNGHPQGVYTGACKTKRLSLDTPGCSWRIDTAAAALPEYMQYFVVRKKDGFPAYQLASLVDDTHFGIDLVVRGSDLWESTQAQTYLAEVLGYPAFRDATFCHHPLLTANGQEKLSKSAGATSVRYFRRQGIAKEEIYQTIGRLLGLAYPVYGWQDLVPSIG